ncbi:hypothetical protein SDC9_132886 [bioreactor metagenome]|uniref:Uncharacterized protein n=1 Tax=bioreactor metagenome TaxID=1076179 RepID=A0A645D914_9ZZZZ
MSVRVAHRQREADYASGGADHIRGVPEFDLLPLKNHYYRGGVHLRDETQRRDDLVNGDLLYRSVPARRDVALFNLPVPEGERLRGEGAGGRKDEERRKSRYEPCEYPIIYPQ